MDHRTGEKLSRKPVAAALVASLLILFLGVTYRVIAARLGISWGATPLDPQTLEKFPMQIGDWTGREVLLDEAIQRKTNADAYINRSYSHSNGFGSVGLYIACGVRARDLVSHRPEVCYISAGWTLVETHQLQLERQDGIRLPCSIFNFSRGGLDKVTISVLHYFIVDGCYCGDVSAAMIKTGRRFGMADYVAQVQITSSNNLPDDVSEHITSDFAVDSALDIARLFGHFNKNRNRVR